MAAVMHVVFPALRTYAIPFDALSSYLAHIWCEKTRMAGLQSEESRMMIDSVVWAQYINVTDTQTAIQPRRHSNSCPNALRRAATQWSTLTSSMLYNLYSAT